MADKATLSIGDKSIDLPVFTGTESEVGIDIGALRSSTGAVTIDNGFANTAPCFSAITFLDGEKGILRYRGYPIDQLAERSTFLECAWLLLYGELPSSAQITGFRSRLANQEGLPEGLHTLIRAFDPGAHPMAVLSSAVAALSAFHPGEERTAAAYDRATDQLIAKVPEIAAASYRRSKGLQPVESDPSRGYTGNFLHMMFGKPGEPYEIDPEVAHALDVLLILHADHEQNCSTSTVRMVGSSHANLFASVTAGVSALWGPLHGGANQKVLEMLERIANDGSDVDKYVAMAKDKDSGFRLMGFGHRVYKNFDPRARIIQRQCDVVLERLGIEDPLLDIARKLERHALEDAYFVERKLYPNVDFYSGIIYRALGIPVEMFTVMFAIGRMPGWISHWREFNEQNLRIGRPRQIYNGATKRDYIDLDAR